MWLTPTELVRGVGKPKNFGPAAEDLDLWIKSPAANVFRQAEKMVRAAAADGCRMCDGARHIRRVHRDHTSL